MNAVDLLILAVLALSMLFGLLRGFVSEVVALASWVAAFWVAWAFGDQVAPWYAGWLREPAARLAAGYVTCFLGVLIVGAALGWVLQKMVRTGGLSGGDRLLGMVFGFARGLLLIVAVVLVLGFTAVPRKSAWWRQSLLLPAFTSGADWIAQRLPANVAHYLELGGKSLRKLPETPISAVRHAADRVLPGKAASTARATGHAPDRD